MKCIFIISVFLSIALLSESQVPMKFNYQAAIRNQNSPVISKTIGMKISILKGNISGTAVYTETHQATTDVFGIVSTEIGGGTVIKGQLSSIDWSDGPYFIKVETDITGGSNYTVSGTSQLLSVPYSLFAETAENGNHDGNVKGDIQYWDGSRWILLPPGNYGQVLTIGNNGLPSWQSVSTVTLIENTYKYLKTSEELSNYENWIHLDQVFKNPGENISYNIFVVTELCQIDYDGDGLEDIYCTDTDSIMLSDQPQILYKNLGGIWLRQDTKIPAIPSGKLLVGDFNNDSRPDIFNLSAYDLPGGLPSIHPNYLLSNDGNGNFIRSQLPGQGHWYAGSSGDIDDDGDLDIVVFNFHVALTNERHRILWNNGSGIFTSDTAGIGRINAQIDHAVLADVNNDGFLDLLINKPLMPNGYGINLFEILWGNSKGYNESNSTLVPVSNPHPICDLDIIDINGDGIKEILFAVTPNEGGWEINLYKSDDRGLTFVEVTDQMISEKKNRPDDFRILFLRCQDIDKNGRMDIFSTGKRENIRWEQDDNGVFRRK
jgi:hypothetical protein